MAKAISVSSLSKRYRLHHQASPGSDSFRDALTHAARRWLSAGQRRGDGGERAGDEEEFWALKDISFEVEAGERLGIIGRNGSGKSTLLKLLSRITAPTEGCIEIRGRVSSLLEVGTGFHPELTGRENIFLNGSILGMSRLDVRRKFDQIVEFAEVERFLDTPVKRYSSGMYVRLAFAVAAHLEPDVLIVDEVLAVGDMAFQRKCLDRMDDVGKSGRTVLFVTHNMDAMTALCSKGIVLEGGRLVFAGTADDTRTSYMAAMELAEYSVERHSGRGGSGGARIDKVWLDGSADQANLPMISGEGLQICLKASVDPSLVGRSDLEVAFGVDSLDGIRLYTVLSSWSGMIVDTNSGVIRVVCQIDGLPLASGRYFISAALVLRGDTLDSIQHCASFNVVPPSRTMHVQRLPGWGALDIPAKFCNIDL